jgi:outer membrane protein TolC
MAAGHNCQASCNVAERSRFLCAWLCALWLLQPSAAESQQPSGVLAVTPLPEPSPEPEEPPPALTVDLAKLLQRAKSDPPAIAVAHAELAQAQAALGAAEGQWLPALTGQASAGFSYDNRLVLPGVPRIDSESLEARAALNFDWAALDAARGTRIDASEAAQRAQQFQLESAQRKAMVMAAEMYLRAGAATSLLADARLSLERRSHQLQAIVDLVNAGTRSPVDAQRAKIEVLSAQYMLRMRRSEEQAAFAALGAALGLPPGERVKPASSSAEFTLAADNPAKARGLAYEHRPEIHAAGATLTALRLERDAAVAERLPTVGASASGNVSYLDVRHGDGLDGPQYGGAAGVYVRWRGLDPAVWFKAKIAAAAADRAEHLREALVHAIGAEAVNAFYALQRAHTETQRALAVLEAAGVAREAQNGRYLAGLASLLELLDAEDLEQQARQRRIEAQRDEAIAQAQLTAACGMLGR